MSEADVRFMFNEMMQRSEQVYLSDAEQIDDKLINLPSFLDALASIIKQLNQVGSLLSVNTISSLIKQLNHITWVI